MFESGAILIYLADKAGKFIPADAAGRWAAIQWVFFQIGAIGPMFGQVGFFNKFAGKAYEDKRPLDRYVKESRRLLEVLDEQLEGREWLLGGDYTIADIAMLGWVRNLITFYEAREIVQYDTLKHVPAWLDRGLARPAVAARAGDPEAGVGRRADANRRVNNHKLPVRYCPNSGRLASNAAFPIADVRYTKLCPVESSAVVCHAPPYDPAGDSDFDTPAAA